MTVSLLEMNGQGASDAAGKIVAATGIPLLGLPAT